MSTNSEQDKALFKQKLLKMQGKFKKSLPERIQNIESAWNQLQKNPADIGHLNLLHRDVHTLTGTAGTFSWQVLSVKSRELEVLLKSLLDEQMPLKNQSLLQIQILFDGIIEVANEPLDSNLIENTKLPSHEEYFGRKVLVIDDDIELNTLISTQLKHFGYKTKSLYSTQEIDEEVAEFRPNLIIIDITFPEGTDAGTEFLTDYCLKEKLGSDIPIIFISSRQDIDARINAVRAGGRAFLSKPLNVSVLLDKVREFTLEEEVSEHPVLIIDDDKSMVELMGYILEESGLLVESITDPRDAFEVISRKRPELILMDVHMPWCTGIELAQVIRQQPSWSNIPIIFLSSETDSEIQFNAVLKAGDDFLSKPIDVTRLALFIKAKVERAQFISSLIVKDGMTGLFNHSHIKELAENEWHRFKRHKNQFSLVLLDVDKFKNINDNYSHVVGDQVLRSLSHFLLQRLRISDRCGRYGGEEFLLILPDTSGENARDVMNKILKDFADIEHLGLNGETFKVTFSAGVVESNQIHENVDVMIELADKMLYQAKNAGRNRVCLARNYN